MECPFALRVFSLPPFAPAASSPPPRPPPPDKPAVLYDLGGKFDKSFNEGVFNGATRFKKETGVDFRDLEIQNEAQREQVLREFAKDGIADHDGRFRVETALKGGAPIFKHEIRHYR